MTRQEMIDRLAALVTGLTDENLAGLVGVAFMLFMLSDDPDVRAHLRRFGELHERALALAKGGS